MKNILILGLVSLGLVACSHSDHSATHGKMKPVYYGYAQLNPTKGSKTSGEIKFSEAFGKVKIEGEVRGLTANSEHGFHIHEFGDCSASDGTSAGGHYNPEGMNHGDIVDEQRHVGDLGNIKADKKGVAKINLEVTDMSVSSGKNPILGRGLIVHARPDDKVSQPTGGAGGRIACGVIGAQGGK